MADEPTLARLIVTNRRDEQGLMYRAVERLHDGRLRIDGHDLGAGVEEFWGMREYEFDRTYSADETARIRELLGVGPDGDLLASIRSTFASTAKLEQFRQGPWNRRRLLESGRRLRATRGPSTSSGTGLRALFGP